MSSVDVEPMEVDNRYAKEAPSSNMEQDDDDNEEPLLETQQPSPEPAGNDTAATTAVSKKPTNAVVFSPELLQMYYARLFPFDLLYQWLSYNPAGHKDNKDTTTKQTARIFAHREFSFTIEPAPGEEIYIRYQSFSNKNELAAAVTKRRPVKIDIGAVFSHPPKDKNAVTDFKPEARELVFDIDLTDYDPVRRCGCSGANICGVCWEYMTMAVKVMDQGLREDFGFAHIAWFYSGRRGVHCWVCDESARALTDQGRSAVASYFEVNLGTDKNKEVALPHPLHPMLLRAYNVLEPMFIDKVLPAEGHGLLASEEQWTALLDDLPEVGAKVRENLLKSWNKSSSSPAQKWSELKKHLHSFVKNSKPTGGNSNKLAKTSSNKDRLRMETWHVEVVFRHTYPRLDINVSKMRNHLLKSPFCVHPKTGRVCVPIRPETVDDFDPFQVPTLPQLMVELDNAGRKNSDATEEESNAASNRPDWYKTSLKQYFEPFHKDFLEPLHTELRAKSRDAEEQQAALVGDF